MSDIGIGRLIKEPQARDAIHVAVAPVTAMERLAPGQPVSFAGDGHTSVCAAIGASVGIVDPFLTAPVFAGERFWLFLWPGSITSLRHDWTHPAFEPKPLDASEQWIRDFASSIPLDYAIVMEGARDYLATGEYLCFGGLLIGESVPDEFWPHYARVTGQKVPEDARGSFFTCSCG